MSTRKFLSKLIPALPMLLTALLVILVTVIFLTAMRSKAHAQFGGVEQPMFGLSAAFSPNDIIAGQSRRWVEATLFTNTTLAGAVRTNAAKVWTDVWQGEYLTNNGGVRLTDSGVYFTSFTGYARSNASPVVGPTNTSIYVIANVSENDDGAFIGNKGGNFPYFGIKDGNLQVRDAAGPYYTYSSNRFSGYLTTFALLRSNGVNAFVYTNSILAGVDTTADNQNWDVTWFGGEEGYDLGFLRGYLHEVIFWDHLLTPTELTQLQTYATTTYRAKWPTPTNAITEFPFLWLDLSQEIWDSGEGPLSDNGSIHSWRNMSPRLTYNPTNVNTTTFKTGGPNSKPYARFQNNGYAQGVGPVPLILSQPLWAFFAVRLDAANQTADNTIMDGGLSQLTNRMIVSLSTVAGVGGLYAGNGATPPRGVWPDNNWHVLSVKFNHADSVARIDGTNWCAGDVGNHKLGGIILGFQPGLPNSFYGDLAEFILYDQNLTTNQVQSVEIYLKNKYGTP